MPKPTQVRTEIRRLYSQTTAATVELDLQRAIKLLKILTSEAERSRMAGYMDGLSQLRSEWFLARRRANRKQPGTSRPTARPPGRSDPIWPEIDTIFSGLPLACRG